VVKSGMGGRAGGSQAAIKALQSQGADAGRVSPDGGP